MIFTIRTTIAKKGFRKLVVDRGGKPDNVDNLKRG